MLLMSTSIHALAAITSVAGGAASLCEKIVTTESTIPSAGSLSVSPKDQITLVLTAWDD